MLQDQDGFLWIGTWAGLIRYDGYNSIVYHSGNGSNDLKSEKITALYEDRNGFIWIGTQVAGLFKFDKHTERFTQFNHKDGDEKSLSDNNVWAIKEDNKNNLWVGTENGLNLFREKTKDFIIYKHNPADEMSLSDNHVTDIYVSSSDHRLWVSTASGLNVMSTDSKNSHQFQNYLFGDKDDADFAEQNFIFKISELEQKNQTHIWYGTSRGLKKIENGKIRDFLIPGKSMSYNSFSSILPINSTRPYLIAGSEQGLNFFDPVEEKFTGFISALDPQVNLSHISITTLFVDNGKVLWVGTKKGLNKLDFYAKNFEAFETSSFDKTRSIITGIGGSLKNGYLISTLGGGLYRFKDKKFLKIVLENKQTKGLENFIQTMYCGSDGSIWLGIEGDGVYRFYEKDININGEVKKFDHFSTRTKSVLSGDFIMSITQDMEGNTWVGEWHGGLNKISRSGEVTFYNLPLLQNTPVVSIFAYEPGALLLGTRGKGLFKVNYNGRQLDIENLQEGDSMVNPRHDFVNAICKDHSGLIWIGTEGGLQSIDMATETIQSNKFDDSSPMNIVTSVLEDNEGKLWLANSEGIEVYDPRNPTHLPKYNYHDRLQGGFFYSNVSFKDETGRLLFGGADGFNIIEPETVFPNPSIPKIVITDFRIFGKSLKYDANNGDSTMLNTPLNKEGLIKLKSKENSISFEFVALEYSAPEKIRYAYMLDGFDEHWNYTTYQRRFAVYTNLGEGHYTFKVKACNSDGLWNGGIKTLEIEIAKPWWKTTWAIALYFAAAIISLYVFRRLILIRANYRHDLKLERLQRENMERLSHAKLHLFTNISHEFRTPLTLILGPVQDLLDRRKGNSGDRNLLININNNAHRLLRLVNQLLDFRKAEAGKLKLEVSERNIVSFLNDIKISFDVLAENVNIQFFLLTSSTSIQAWFDADQFEKIMFNLLSNAFKNTPEGGKITLSIKENDDDIIISVEDNGKGVKRENFENIFQTFFSYDEDKHHTGTGIGLAFAKTLVEMHRGQLEFASEPYQCTKFTIRLKKGSAHFKPEEMCSSDLKEVTDGFPSVETEHKLSELAELTEQHRRSILIVEDSEDVRHYLTSIFIHEYNILQAGDGEQALSIAIQQIPDLIISDVMMPVMDGITLCTKLKSNTKTSHVPVILLTAKSSPIFKIEGLETGADDYVTKPFNSNVLKLKVRNLIHSREILQEHFKDKNILNIEPKRVTLTSLDEIFVKNALQSVEQNMSNLDYGVDILGRDVGMSQTQLYRKLKAVTGQSANEFIRTIRLKRAAQLLEQNRFTIAEVTHQVGFNDRQYFRDCFKKLFGVVPSEYVKNNGLAEHRKEVY